jgi:hypothetical protein
LNLNDYLPPRPYLAENRFWVPIRLYDHGVFPLMPWSEELLNEGTRLAWDVPADASSDAEIEQLDLSAFNVGLRCGKLSGVTVLKVSTQAAQDWLDDQELPRTPQWLGRGARYYLFKYAPLPNATTEVLPGLHLLNDDAFVIYPGSIYDDGRLVYWEDCPDCTEAADLPDWLVPAAAVAC